MTLRVLLKSENKQPPSDMRLYVYDDQMNSWPAVRQLMHR